MRRDFHGGMHPTGGCATNHQRNFAHPEIVVFLHFAGDILHFFQRRCDQARQANDVCAFDFGLGQYVVAGHHHPHVDHIKVVALQNHRDNVFANVMHIAFDRGNHDLAFGFHFFARGFLLAFFFLDVRNQMRHGLLHDPRTFDDLWQKHLALTKQITHQIHAVHERPFDHMQRATAGGQHLAVGFFGVRGDEVGDAVHQRMA